MSKKSLFPNLSDLALQFSNIVSRVSDRIRKLSPIGKLLFWVAVVYLIYMCYDWYHYNYIREGYYPKRVIKSR